MSESLYSILRMENAALDEVTEARLIFEPHVARLAAKRISDEDIRLIEANIARTEAVLRSKKPSTAENIEFHSLIAGSLHNRVIALTMKTLLDVARIMTIETHDKVRKRLAISVRSHKQHKHLLEALRKRDSERAYKLMFDHIVEIQEALRAAITGRQH